jgi:hypothetical protein
MLTGATPRGSRDGRRRGARAATPRVRSVRGMGGSGGSRRSRCSTARSRHRRRTPPIDALPRSAASPRIRPARGPAPGTPWSIPREQCPIRLRAAAGAVKYPPRATAASSRAKSSSSAMRAAGSRSTPRVPPLLCPGWGDGLGASPAPQSTPTPEQMRAANLSAHLRRVSGRSTLRITALVAAVRHRTPTTTGRVYFTRSFLT